MADIPTRGKLAPGPVRELITVADAVARYHIPLATIRRWAEAGEVEHEVEHRGLRPRRLLYLDSLLRRIAQRVVGADRP